MMTGPGDELSAAQDSGAIRASDSDRQQVVGALKTAFVQGRLTQDELGARVDQVYASRTYADLTEVVADIPTALADARRKRAPWRATKRALWFVYAAFLPGIAAVICLPSGPHSTIWTLLPTAAICYPVFWSLGLVKPLVARYVKPLSEPQLPPPAFFDRDQATRALKTALAEGRLTDDEHDTRAAEVPATRSRAELAALTADLPANLTARLPITRDPWTGACVSIAAAGVLAALILAQPDNPLAFLLGMLCAAMVILAPPVTVGLMVDARHQRQIGSQLRLGPTLR
jgi:hypothetical protein